MAIDKKTIVEKYPLPAYNYRVTIDGKEEGMSFSEVSGLEIDHDYKVYRHGFSWAMGDYLLRGRRKPINVTLKRGVVKQRSFLYDWLRSMDKKDMNIALCDQNGNPIVSWEVYRALPLKMDAPSFSANASDVAIESLALVAHDLKLTHHE